MSNDILAIHGGTPVISNSMAHFKSVGEDEVVVVSEVIRSGVLSAYIGAPGPGFMGGTQVRQFERQAAEYFGVKHAIAVNSWTSGLIAAVGAIAVASFIAVALVLALAFAIAFAIAFPPAFAFDLQFAIALALAFTFATSLAFMLAFAMGA